MRTHLAQAGEIIVKLTHNLAAILLAVASVLVTIQVVTRFVFNDPASWTEIAARGVVIWMVFMVAAAGFRYSAMIPLEFIRNVVPPSIRRWVMVLVTFATLLFLCILVWYGTRMTIRVSNQQIAMLNISMAWFYSAVPIGAALAIPGVILSHFCPKEIERGAVE